MSEFGYEIYRRIKWRFQSSPRRNYATAWRRSHKPPGSPNGLRIFSKQLQSFPGLLHLRLIMPSYETNQQRPDW